MWSLIVSIPDLCPHYYFTYQYIYFVKHFLQSTTYVKCSIVLKTFLQQGMSESVSHDEVVYYFLKIAGKHSLPGRFKKLIKRYTKEWDIT